MKNWFITGAIAIVLTLSAFMAFANPTGPNPNTGLCETSEMLKEQVLADFPDAKFLSLDPINSKAFATSIFTQFPGAPIGAEDVGGVTLVNAGTGSVFLAFYNFDGCYLAGINLPAHVIDSLIRQADGS